MKNLLLDLKLDQIENNNQLIDSSGNNNNGTINSGNPQIVPDDTFGHCLSFDGNGDSVSLPPRSIPTGNEITVSFWANGGNSLPKQNSIILATTASNHRTLNIHFPWSDSIIYFDCGGNYDRTSKLAQARNFKGKWTHWAFTKNAANGEMKIYLNGSLWHSDTGKNKPIIAATKATLGSGYGNYHGKVAHFRIYSKALKPGQILRDMEENLPPENYLIKGRITDKNSGFGVPGLRVEVWDKDYKKEDDFCGCVLTDRQGNYKVEFDSSVFSGAGKQDRGKQRGLDFYVKVFYQEQLIKSTEQSVKKNLPAGEHELSLEVELPEQPEKQIPQPVITTGINLPGKTPPVKTTGMRLPVQAPPIIRPTILYGNVGDAYSGSRASGWQCSPCLNGYRICVWSGATAQPVRIESC